MRKAIFYFLFIANLNLMAQDPILNWRAFYTNKLISIPDMQVETLSDANRVITHRPIAFKYDAQSYAQLIKDQSYKTFLEDYYAPRELSNIPNILSFDSIHLIIDNLIENSDSKTNLAFTPKYNVFHELYERYPDKTASINSLLNRYLRKATQLYPSEWLDQFALFCEFADLNEYQALHDYWVANSGADTTEFYHTINRIRFLRFQLPDIKKEWEAILGATIHETDKIYLMYVLSSNRYLTGADKAFLQDKLHGYKPMTSFYRDLCVFHSAIKNLDAAYIIPQDLKYVKPIDWTIQHLQSHGLLPPGRTIAYRINSKFFSNYNLQTEKLLSWIFNLSGGLSAYYAYMEPVEITSEYLDEVFFDYFNTSHHFPYALEKTGDTFKITINVEDKALIFTINTQDAIQLGFSFEYITNLILEHTKSDKRLIRFEFEYPLYFIQTKENLEFLEREYKLVREP